MSDPRISVVINTDGRAKALSDTISGLRRLDYDNFEICIVYGPTQDGTYEYVASLGELVKSAHCPVRNLSQSRNIGIAIASGEIVAFIDDDGIPEPEWLNELSRPFVDDSVCAAGGIVYDHTGFELQYTYADCNRLGNARQNLPEPPDDFNYPFSSRFPYIQGTNAAFRRSSLLQIGGFDEEYEFYLDETDVCCRINDIGGKISQLSNARVHHKFLRSEIRNHNRITVKKFAVMKNKIYFSFVNNHGNYSYSEIVADALQFISNQRLDILHHIEWGGLTHDDLSLFEEEAERAWAVGLARGLSGARRTRDPVWFGSGEDFRKVAPLRPQGGKRTFLFLSQDYPPGKVGGVARYTHDIARAVANIGHTVHVLTDGFGHNRVDLEQGVWVHRIVPKQQPPRRLPDGRLIPAHIWNRSATLLEEALRINKARPIDVVEGVSWDCETAAFIMDGRFPVATNIVTSLAHWLETHPEQANDKKWMTDFGAPMLELEKIIYQRSDRIIAASEAIVNSVEALYDISLTKHSVVRCPHGLDDMRLLPTRPPRPALSRDPKRLAILFVGRLERRKGVDTLLAAATRLLSRRDDLEFWLAGDTSLETGEGLTEKERFLRSGVSPSAVERVRFLGVVDDPTLVWLYDHCDILVAPSRFESFGLIFVEAMMFGKPVVGCQAGAIPEVVTDGETGLLVEAGDTEGLVNALERLADDRSLRASLGTAGRRDYESRFAAEVVANHRVSALSQVYRSEIRPERIVMGEASIFHMDDGQSGIFIPTHSRIRYRGVRNQLFLTCVVHEWSGILTIGKTRGERLTYDLYSPERSYKTICINVGGSPADIIVQRTGAANPAAKGTETIIVSAKEH